MEKRVKIYAKGIDKLKWDVGQFLTDRQTDRQTDRLYYIDGLKGIACVMIMVCHYIAIVKYSTNLSCFPIITRIYNSRFSTIIDESFWLQLFFVFSGFLLSYAKISTVKEFMVKAIKRFLRLYLPIFAACIIIFVIYSTIGFHNAETVSAFTCKWYQAFYSSELTLWDLLSDPLKTVFIGGSVFNSPYWVIRDMFYSSVIIYFVNFLSIKIDKIWFKPILLLLLAITLRFTLGSIYFACLIGAVCGVILSYQRRDISQKLSGLMCVICVIMPLGLHTLIYALALKMCNIIQINPYALKYLAFKNTTWGVLYFSLLIYFIGKNVVIKKISSQKVLCALNEVSFGIYSFHWPLICSIGALIILGTGLKNGIILSWVICIFLTLILSVVYHYLIEIYINKLLKRIHPKVCHD